MKIAIAGGTGFVGKALVNHLIENNHEVVILTRTLKNNDESGSIKYVQWLEKSANPLVSLQETDIFVNLSGESINSGRWTEERKKRIVDSRIQTVAEILNIMKRLDRKPLALINASAVGFYGTSEIKMFTEKDAGANNDFLSRLVMEWEDKASDASKLGIRTVLCRFGVILDKNKGALPRMTLPYKAFVGGTVGNGRQWISWIHIKDVVRGILYAIDHDQIQGPVNFTAPNPISMKEFGLTLASVLHQPHWLPVPNFALQLLLGEMSTIVLEGQKVLPEKLLQSGFHFQYPELNKALSNIFSN
ncbi:TIGR01777 family oxidoreductase [Neobacillus sp. PS3-40]|uniref:TIGR01777 family oxidoreductase n=1 Tax=Neobacillus sp. PS3-40 TaxID=3070679 RepID=UPI0027DFFF5E|nr:TIGR01777 family oxidoreductase [Neobacillus sp. PS3-40]WML43058.1 TIGR01777 family oxidoreductase [Neobacillus sp. PS3-40]